MVNISSYSISQLTDLANRTFLFKNKTLPQIMRKSPFVITDTIPHGTWDTRRYAEDIDADQYAGVRDEGWVARQAKVQYGYEKDSQLYTIAQERSIAKVMRDTGKERDIINRLTFLGEVGPNTIDLDLAHRLTFHTATSYQRTAWGTNTTTNITTGDGLALASTVHTLTGSATTYSNIISGNPQFSKGSLENAEKLFVEETYDNLGVKMYMEPDCIILTDDPNSNNQAKELLHATANVNTSNSGTFNAYSNKYKVVSVPRIATTASWAPDTTKRKYRFLAASKSTTFYFSVLNEPYLKTPMDGNNGEVFSSEDWNYMCVASYAIAIVTPKRIKCSTGLWA